MSTFIGLIGLLGFSVCVVLMIIKAIMKKPKKKTLIALAVSFLLIIVWLAIPSDSNSTEAEIQKPTVSTQETTPELKPEQTPEPIPEATTDPAENAYYCKILLEAFLKESFDYSSIEGDETGFTISIAGDGLANAVLFQKAAGYDENYSDWASMKESIIYCSDQIQNIMKESGLEDAVLMINVLNDQNHDNTLLTLINGVVVYDVMAEQ